MATKKYKVETDGGSYIVEVEDDSGVPAGDTIRARAEMNSQEGQPGLLKGMSEMGRGMAHPQTVGDFTSLLLPSDLGLGGGAKYLGEVVSRGATALRDATAES